MVHVVQPSDLYAVTECPMGDKCEKCQSQLQLNLETVSTQMGIFCLTLCDECCEFERLPKFFPVQVVERVLEHCVHLGIDADRMAALMEQEEREQKEGELALAPASAPRDISAFTPYDWEKGRWINEWDDSIDDYAPCQPIGCDHGRHLPGCYYTAGDEQ